MTDLSILSNIELNIRVAKRLGYTVKQATCRGRGFLLCYPGSLVLRSWIKSRCVW